MTLPSARQIQQAFQDLGRFEAERLHASSLAERGEQLGPMLSLSSDLGALACQLKATTAKALHIKVEHEPALQRIILGLLAMGINLGARATEIRLDARD